MNLVTWCTSSSSKGNKGREGCLRKGKGRRERNLKGGKQGWGLVEGEWDTQGVVSIILFAQQVCQYEYFVTRIAIRLYCWNCYPDHRACMLIN